MNQVIYKIVNAVNDKFYVGSTNNHRERFRTHRNKLRRGTHHCAHLQAAWNKYGEEKFLFKVVETVPGGNSLQEAENRWLEEHFGKAYCYNAGRRSGAPWRNVAPENHPNFGRIVTQEQRRQIAEALKAHYAQSYFNHPRVGKTHSEETKERIRAKKKQNPQRFWLGKIRTDETKAKISRAQKDVPKKPRTYTEEGLAKIREVMRKNAREQHPADFDAVKNKFPSEVLDKYDFTNAVYQGALIRIEGCMCPIHGVFSQYAAQFRKGRGCPSCGALERALSKSVQMKQSWASEEGRSLFMANRMNVASSAP